MRRTWQVFALVAVICPNSLCCWVTVYHVLLDSVLSTMMCPSVLSLEPLPVCFLWSDSARWRCSGLSVFLRQQLRPDIVMTEIDSCNHSTSRELLIAGHITVNSSRAARLKRDKTHRAHNITRVRCAPNQLRIGAEDDESFVFLQYGGRSVAPVNACATVDQHIPSCPTSLRS